MIKCLWMKWRTQTQPLKPLIYMFRYLNQVPMCPESEYTAKSIFSAPFGGHLGFMQIK